LSGNQMYPSMTVTTTTMSDDDNNDNTPGNNGNGNDTSNDNSDYDPDGNSDPSDTDGTDPDCNIPGDDDSDEDDDGNDNYPQDMPKSNDDEPSDDTDASTDTSEPEGEDRPGKMPEDDVIADGDDDDVDNIKEPRSVEPTPTNIENERRRYNLRGNRSRSYVHRFDHQMDKPENRQSYEARIQLLQDTVENVAESPNRAYKYICGHIMTQMMVTAGIKKHGQLVIDVLLAEFGQLDDKNVFEACDASTLTKEQK